MTNEINLDEAKETPLLLKPTHAAQLLDCGRSTIYDLINRGLIKVVRVGTLLRIPLSEIERLAAGNAPKAE